MCRLQKQCASIQCCANYKNFVGSCEKQWAEKITIEQRKREYLAIWGYVRSQLAEYLQVDPKVLRFGRTAYGKPYLKNFDLAFNVSHTKQHVALCFAASVKACGIDIEVPRKMSDMLGVAERFFAAEEFQFLSGLPNKDLQQHFFFKYWVIKEAILKTCGLGLSFGIEKVKVDIERDQNEGEVVLNIDGAMKQFQWQYCCDDKQPYYLATAVCNT